MMRTTVWSSATLRCLIAPLLLLGAVGCDDVSSHDTDCETCAVRDGTYTVASLAQRVMSESASDDMIREAIHELNESRENLDVLRELLDTKRMVDELFSGYIFMAGESGALSFAPRLYDIVITDPPHEDALSEEGRLHWHVNQNMALGALGKMGALEQLIALYEEVPPELKNLVRLELHLLDSERWPMRQLPTEILTDYKADAEYAADFEARLAGQPRRGIVILDDPEEDEYEEADLDAEFRIDEEFHPPPPVVDDMEARGLESVEHQSAGDGHFRATTSAATYACGVTSPLRSTANELQQKSQWCNNSLIAAYWDGYDFTSSWNASMGFDTPCDLNTPLGRTFNAIHLLHTASPSPPLNYSDMSGDILRWGGNYAMREIIELRASCATDAGATTNAAVLKKNRHVTMKRSSFYDFSTATRAALIIHEARHTERCRHNGNDGSNQCPAESTSCDESMYDGCRNLVLAPSGQGAVGFETTWLQAYLTYAPASKITAYQRTQARAMANKNLNQYLDVEPYFNLALDGSIYYYKRPTP